ncbi:MAG: response regulator [Planctomycetia bacterium]|nr:response regulator [Planctomycetia bacterium]
MSQPQTQSLLRDGIAAAQAGGKTRARRLIRQVVDQEPGNETAWLWLANVAADHAEALESLRTVLKINPENRHAKAGLVTAIVRVAIDATQAKDFPQARQLLREALELDPNHEHALLWSAGVAVYPSDSIRFLRRALEVNPDSERAKQGLAQFQDEFGSWTCPLCEAPSRESTDRCPTCRAVLTLGDPTAFDSPTGADETAMGRAIARLTPLAQKAPGGPDAFRLGLAYLNIGQPTEAIKVFNAAATRPDADAKWKTGVTKLASHWRQTGANRPAKAELAAGGPPLIFVVDDSATVRKLVTVALQDVGYRVVSFADGLQVADGIKAHGVPALAILDIAMPGLDGFQVCTLLRENPATAKVPVFFLTGKDNFLNRMRAKWAGAVEYHTKPFQPKSLIAIVERHVPLPIRHPVAVSN